MNREYFWITLLAIISIIVGVTAQNLGDFNTFYAGGVAVLQGVNPYTVPGFYSPLYVAWLFALIAIMPRDVAFHLFAAAVFAGYAVAFYLITRRSIKLTLALMCTPFPLFTAWYGNLEGWVLLGAALAPVVGIWLVLTKPQIGVVVALLFAWQTWLRTRSLARVGLVVLPVGVVYALSLWLGMGRILPTQESWNISLWPWGLILGLPVAFMALRDRDRDLALLAGPLISPYLGNPASFAGMLPWISRRRWLLAIGVVGSWAILFYWRGRL